MMNSRYEVVATSIGYGPTLIFLMPCLFVVLAVGIASLIFQISSHKLASKLWKLQPWTILFTLIVGISLHVIASFQLKQFPKSDPSFLRTGMDGALEAIAWMDYQFLLIITKGIIFWLICFAVRAVKKV
jgi:hypothetical protein